MSVWHLEIDVTLDDGTDPEEALYRIERAILHSGGVADTFSTDWSQN